MKRATEGMARTCTSTSAAPSVSLLTHADSSPCRGSTGVDACIYPTAFAAKPLQILHPQRNLSHTSKPERYYPHRSAGEQLVPCSNRCASVVIERDDAGVFRKSSREGEASGVQTNVRHALSYLSSAEARGVIIRREQAPGTRVEHANPHAIGDLARGVKDLLVQSR